MDPLDLDRFRLPAGLTAPAKPSRHPPRHRNGEKFLKGPIPWTWLETAMAMPGKSLAVALVLWREAGCRNNRTVRLCLRGALPPGLNRWSARRGLQQLKAAGLAAIASKPGRCLEVTILESPAPPNNGKPG
jgi:hypothetical protein